MVDGVGPNAGVQNQMPLGNVTTEQAARAEAAKGIAAETGLTVEQASKLYDRMEAGLNQHDCRPPAPGAMPNLPSSVQLMDEPEWDSTCDIFMLIHKALEKNAEEQNNLEVDENASSVKQMENWLDERGKLADDTATLAHNQGIAQMVGGGLQVGGGVMAGVTSANQGVSQAWSAAGSGTSGAATGIEGYVDASLQGTIKDDETAAGVAEDAKDRSAKLRDKFGDSFRKSTGGQDTVEQQQASAYNAAAQAMNR